MDTKLKTIQVENQSSVLHDFFRLDKTGKRKEEVKNNIYNFVASNAIQIPMMLRGKRMDWVDLRMYESYHIEQLNIQEDQIKVLEYSLVNPKEITRSDLLATHYNCTSTNKNDLIKYIKIINERIKLTRTNYSFWEKTLKIYAQKHGLKYVPPEKFPFLKLNFSRKEKIDSGDYD